MKIGVVLKDKVIVSGSNLRFDRKQGLLVITDIEERKFNPAPGKEIRIEKYKHKYFIPMENISYWEVLDETV